MNKKEIAEIKKNFTDTSGYFTLNHVFTAYIDHEKNIRCKSNRLFSLIPEDEGSVLMESMKKVLSGSVGKALIEYSFPNDQYNEGGAQNDLYNTLRSRLKDESPPENDPSKNQNSESETTEPFIPAVEKLLIRIINNMEYESSYSVIIGHCSYSVMTKDKNDDEIDSAADEFNFLVTAICPVNTGDDGLIFDDESNEIVKKTNTDLIISRVPTDGFLYPVFSDRSTDINRVMYFTKNTKKPNISIVNNVLGCEFTMSAHSEKETFQEVLSDVVGDDLDYTVITRINEKIKEVVEQTKNDTELTVLDSNRLENILSESGVSNEKLEALPAVFKAKVGEQGLTAVNLVENKTIVSTPEITVNISKEATDKVRTSVINGRRCLIIDLDDPSICINGLTTSLT